MPLERVIDAESAGNRLDSVLKTMTGLSTRGARRLCEDGRVLLNGRRAKAGATLKKGDRVSVLPTPESPAEESGSPSCRLLKRDNEYAFFLKPSGLHTAALQGRPSPCLEDAAPGLLGAEPSCVRLLQRLDRDTSGIVAAALSAEAEQRFRIAEREGRIVKKYVCVLQGALDRELTVRSRLVSSSGAAVRVLDREDEDSARWTRFTPLRQGTTAELTGLEGRDDGLTLCGVTIHRGARHQIRAHAMAAGHPLIFDTLYGAPEEPGKKIFLHHGHLEVLARRITVLPDWNCPAEAREAMAKWLDSESV